MYPIIPNDEGSLFLKKALDRGRNKSASTESHIKLPELILKNNYFEFNDRFRKQKEGTKFGIIGTKFALPYVIIFMSALVKEILESLLRNLGCGGGTKMIFS